MRKDRACTGNLPQPRGSAQHAVLRFSALCPPAAHRWDRSFVSIPGNTSACREKSQQGSRGPLGWVGRFNSSVEQDPDEQDCLGVTVPKSNFRVGSWLRKEGEKVAVSVCVLQPLAACWQSKRQGQTRRERFGGCKPLLSHPEHCSSLISEQRCYV